MHDVKCDRCGVSCPDEYVEGFGACPRDLCPICAEDVGLCDACELADRLAA